MVWYAVAAGGTSFELDLGKLHLQPRLCQPRLKLAVAPMT
jgi:hypothetical protein